MVKVISTATIRSFEPKFDGNMDLPPADRIVIEHKAPTVSIKEKLFPRKFDFIDGQASLSIEIDRKKLIRELTTAIKNCSYSIDGREVKIATVEQLFDAPIEFDALIEEIYAYYNDLLNQKVNEKN